MVIHSDSNLGALLTLIAILGGGIVALTSIVLFTCGRFRPALRMLVACVAWFSIYAAAVMVVSLRAPRTIVDIGNAYCRDVWCIGIVKVGATPHGQEIVYKVEVHIFSDASTEKISASGASLWLIDERGRRFPLVKDRAAVPSDVTLDPGQSVNTSLTFVAKADARQLFLTGDTARKPPFWVRLYFGSDDSLLHKRTLLRVV